MEQIDHSFGRVENTTFSQRYKKYKQEPQSQQPQQPEKKQTPKSELERMFNSLRDQGVAQEAIDAAIDSLKEDEGVEELSAKLEPKKEEVDQSALRTEYQERYSKIPATWQGVSAAERAHAVKTLNQEFRGRGLQV